MSRRRSLYNEECGKKLEKKMGKKGEGNLKVGCNQNN